MHKKTVTDLIKLSKILNLKERNIYSNFLLSLAFVFISILISLSVPIVLKHVIMIISNPQTTMWNILIIIFAYGSLWIFYQISLQLRQILLYQPLTRLTNIISAKAFEHLHSLPVKFHINKETGAVNSIILKAQESLSNMFWSFFLFLAPTVLEIVLTFTLLCYLYGWYYGVLLVATIIFFVYFTFLKFRKVSKAQSEANDSYHKVNAYTVESISNFMIVKYFNNAKYENKIYNKQLQEKEITTLNFLKQSTLLNLGQVSILGIGLISLTFISGYQISTGIYNVGDFIVINGYIMQFAIPLSSLGMIYRDIQVGLLDMSKLLEIFDIPNDTNEKNACRNLKNITEISFQNVFFDYSNEHNKKVSLLRDINFKTKKGETIAILGVTGSGKSTITNLLFKFYKPQSGKILFNGVDINNIKSPNINSLISIIPQDTNLLNTSIYNNIIYSKPSASKKEVNKVIELAGLKDTISQLPDKEFTVVGEKGAKLSGGEKQRVAIARGLLKKASVYIFDESTSALDAKTEREVLRNIKKVKKDAIYIIISHRIQNIKDADKIVVIQNGAVTEERNHKELILQRG